MRFFSLLALATAGFFLGSCNKSSDSTDTLGNWIKRSDFEGVARTEAVSFTLNSKGYICTGYDGTNRLNDLWQFDQTTGTWRQKANFPGAARNSAVAFTAAGKGYVGTGYDGLNRLGDFYQYNDTTNVWTRKADFTGTARYSAVAFAVNEKGYVGTGYDGNHLKDMYQYDPTTNAWTQKASLGGTKRRDATAWTINGKGYICAGINNGTYVNDFWEYDATADAWTEKRKISNVSDESYDDSYNIIRSNAVAFTKDNVVYLSTGENGSSLGTTWAWTPSSDTWTLINPLEGTARTGAVSLQIGNRGYVATGNNSSYRFDDIWELIPGVAKNAND